MIVIVGGGIVGTSVAFHLSRRGVRDVLILDAGLPGSTSHAPGLVGLLHSSPTLVALARRSADLYEELGAFHRVGSVEVARREPYLAGLQEKVARATGHGLAAELVDPADLDLPGLDLSDIAAAAVFPEDGIADPAKALAAMATGERRHARVVAVEERRVLTADGPIDADAVALCGGIWTPTLHDAAIVPVAHRYAVTAGPDDDGLPHQPFVRDPEHLIYVRQHGRRHGVGSYRHDPEPIDPQTLSGATLPLDDTTLRPALDTDLVHAPYTEAFGGVYSLTPDGLPLAGTIGDGLWLAAAVWVTHAPAVGEAIAAHLTGQAPPIDISALDPARFDHLDAATKGRQALGTYRL
jgi:glycine/D-amino acid oxidase-like deaminating enzyme